MSVGGKVIEVIEIRKDKIWVNTFDNYDKCAIFLDPIGKLIRPGDSVWWQGNRAYWTKNKSYDLREYLNEKVKADTPLPKITWSGVSRKTAISKIPFFRRMIFKLRSKRHELKSYEICIRAMNEEQEITGINKEMKKIKSKDEKVVKSKNDDADFGGIFFNHGD